MKGIPLTQGKVALVDDEDYDILSAFKWYAHQGTKSWYAWRNARQGNKRVTILMHRQVLSLSEDGPHVDHRDLDGLNNQKSNLRTATKGQNAANSAVRSDSVSGVKGVRFVTRGKYTKWEVSITVNRKSKWIGGFDSLEEASQAYAKAAKQCHGEFARP